MITSKAGLSGFTNHCLRATAMTRMYNSGVPEKVIADKSGHRSIDGLRAYEHPSMELYRAARRSFLILPRRLVAQVVQRKQKLVV